MHPAISGLLVARDDPTERGSGAYRGWNGLSVSIPLKMKSGESILVISESDNEH
jgi:hypothetical protein